jgi:hypothetical protein
VRPRRKLRLKRFFGNTGKGREGLAMETEQDQGRKDSGGNSAEASRVISEK